MSAWAAENERLEGERAAASSKLFEAQARELRERFADIETWRDDFDSFAAATRASQHLLREEIRQSLADVMLSQPASSQHDIARITATLSSCEERLDTTDGALTDLRKRLDSNGEPLLITGGSDTVAHNPEGDRWRNLMGPAVRLSGGGTVGSAVLLQGEQTASGWRTQLLTAWHVVRDIRLGLGEEALIPVSIYNQDGSTREEEARLVCRDASMDIALLELTNTGAQFPGALLASRKSLDSVKIFEPVFAVGCPLGNDPIPTQGQLSDAHHMVDGTRHWMISAPTYIGNSGGGIFHAETGELVGIFSKLYTHGTLRPTVVPHMGLAVPLTEIYDWLEVEGHASLIPGSAEPVVASAAVSAR